LKPDHLVDLFAGAELFARKHLDLHLVVGALRDVLGKEFGRQMRRLAGRQRMGHADLDGLLCRCGRGMEQGDQRNREQGLSHGLVLV